MHNGPVAAVIAEHIPAWVVPPLDELGEAWRVAENTNGRAYTDDRDEGVHAALIWLVLGEFAPMTGRTDGNGREIARSESWVALCAAGGQEPPRARDWERLGAGPCTVRPQIAGNREYAYGVWRALAWLLGTREDWPIYTSWHRAASLPRERPHMLVPVAQWDTDVWRDADRASRERAEQDALHHWRHVRRLADAN